MAYLNDSTVGREVPHLLLVVDDFFLFPKLETFNFERRRYLQGSVRVKAKSFNWTFEPAELGLTEDACLICSSQEGIIGESDTQSLASQPPISQACLDSCFFIILLF